MCTCWETKKPARWQGFRILVEAAGAGDDRPPHSVRKRGGGLTNQTETETEAVHARTGRVPYRKDRT